MKQITALMAAILITCGTAGFAQNETRSFTGSVKSAGNETRLPNGDRNSLVNMAFSTKHSFAITPEQEALLAQGGSINVVFDEMSVTVDMNEDPKWQPGATSIKIKTIETTGIGTGKRTISAKWGKGQMSISVKLDIVLIDLPLGIESKRAPGHPNATTTFRTAFLGTQSFACEGYVSYDSKLSRQETIKTDGTRMFGIKGSIKSKTVVDEPISVDRT